MSTTILQERLPVKDLPLHEVESLVCSLKTNNNLLQWDNAALREEIALLKKKLFGSSSEKQKKKVEPELQENTLFNEAEALAAAERAMEEALGNADEEAQDQTKGKNQETEVKGHTRIKRGGRKPLPEDLERKDVIHEIPESERACHCGGTLEEIGEEVTEKAALIPAKAYVERQIRKKYACSSCAKNMKRAETPAEVIPKSQATANLLSVVLNAKYGLHLPLYRIENQLSEFGLEFTRSTLALWIIKVGELIRPLTNCLQDHILSQSTVHCDETTVQVLGEKEKRAESKSYMWALSSGTFVEKRAVYFEYHSSRSAEAAKKILKGYSGIVHCDGYKVYQSLDHQFEARMSCMAHIRRKFFDASKAGSHKGTKTSEKILEWIKLLYEIEKECKDFEPEKRKEHRETHARTIFVELRDFIEETLPKVTPKSLLGKALSYGQKQLVNAELYLSNGEVSIDNNNIENAIRPFCLGRKNWLFCQSEDGAHTSARVYSLLCSAQRNGLSVRKYFDFVLPKLAELRDENALTPENLRPLLPHSVTL